MDRCWSLNILAQKTYSVHLSFLNAFLLSLVFIIGGLFGNSEAQVTTAITSDGTLGTIVTQIEDVHDVTGGTRPGDGPNLFHSFGQFDVGTGDFANFLNETNLPTDNILSRVTGGDASQIFGTIQTTGFGGANLFLMNPAGVLFGPSASLNVGGSFHVTTADFLRLGDEGIFYAELGKESVLTMAQPEAFGFLNENPAGITIEQSLLEVQPGESLSLLGGALEIVGGAVEKEHGLLAPGGQITLVSVASKGEVTFETSNASDSPNLDSFETLGDIVMTLGADMSVDGEPAGTVSIRGGRLVLEGGVGAESTTVITAATEGEVDHSGLGIDIEVRDGILLKASEGEFGVVEIASSSFGSGKAGSINISADTLQLVGLFPLTPNIGSRVFGAGDGGELVINTNSLILGPGTTISTQVFGSGTGGDIAIETNSLQVVGEEAPAFISASTFSTGNAGNLSISAENVVLQGGSGGFVGLASQVSANAQGDPDAGKIQVAANSLNLIDGAQISSDLFIGSGQGGDIEVNVGSLTISGQTSTGFPSGIFTNLNFPSTGDPGNIHVISQDVLVTNRGRITASSFSFGNSGGIEVESQHLTVSNGATIASNNFGAASAGNIQIKADEILLAGPGPVGGFGTGLFALGGVQAQGGGNIILKTGQLNILDGAQVSTSTAGQGPGGTIEVSADAIRILGTDPGSLSPDGIRSGIFASTNVFLDFVDFATGRGGNIDIHASTLEVKDQGTISAFSGSQGDGGTIEIFAESFGLSSGASIAADSTFSGNAGNVAIMTSGSTSTSNSSVTSSADQTIGGDVTITAGGDLLFTNNTLISTETSGPNDAGDILLSAANSINLANSAVRTIAEQADGGNIKLTASDLIQLTDSQVTSSVGGGPTTVGGNINVDPQFIILQNSQILAQAFAGQGGDITLTAGVVLADSFSTIDASSDLGINGSVNIQASIQQLSETVAPLPEAIVSVAALYAQQCAAQKGGQFSSMVLGGHDGLPTPPGGFLPSPLLFGTPVSTKLYRSNLMTRRLGLEDTFSTTDHFTGDKILFTTPTPECTS